MAKRIKLIERNVTATSKYYEGGNYNSVIIGRDDEESQRNLKWFIAIYCSENGLHYCTDALMKDGVPYDIIVPEWGVLFKYLKRGEKSPAKKLPPELVVIEIREGTDLISLQMLLEGLFKTAGENKNYYRKIYKERRLGVKQGDSTRGNSEGQRSVSCAITSVQNSAVPSGPHRKERR